MRRYVRRRHKTEIEVEDEVEEDSEDDNLMEDVMIVIALDYGERRIGVAVSDALGIAAHALDNIERDGTEFDAIARLVKEREAVLVVVGLPIQMDGKEGPAARRVRGFAKELRSVLQDVKVETVDERLTSAQANKALGEMGTRRRDRISVVDGMAAQFILQRYLEARRTKQPEG